MTTNLANYLGVPLLHGRVLISSYNYVLEKVKNRLSRWKMDKLSMAGRVTLCKVVLLALPIYTTQSVALPKAICDEIEKLCRQFIWGDSEGKKKVHLINWDQVCQPLANGGLGINHMRSINDGLLMKLAWGLITEKEALWVQVLKRHYRMGEELWLNLKVGLRPSPIWRGLCKVLPEVVKRTRWVIGDGSQVNFWKDMWLGDGMPLIEKAINPIPESMWHAKVKDFVDGSGGWNWGLL